MKKQTVTLCLAAKAMLSLMLTAVPALAEWTPSNITCAAWYDASDTTKVLTDGSAVTNWMDKSGNSLYLSQMTGALQPATGSTINSLNAIDFTGDKMETASNPFGATINNAFVITVHKVNSISNGILFSLTGSETASNRWNGHAPWGDGKMYFDCGAAVAPNRIFTNYNVSAGNVVLASFYCSTADNVQQVYKNGSMLTNDSTGHVVTNIGNIMVGGVSSSYQDTTIGEFIVINGTVSAATRQRMEGYLANKWGLTASLPANHPLRFLGVPLVSNAGITSQGAGVCTLQGMVTTGGFANAWICWATNDCGIISTSAWLNVASIGEVSQSNTFSTVASGLATNVTYWYRCYVTNEYGVAWSPEGTSFSAAPAPAYQIFTNSGTLTVSVDSDIEYLIVGGGGGAGCGVNSTGNRGAGGGGAGGFLTGTVVNVSAGSYTVTVGAGGAAATSPGAQGMDGTNSTVFGLTAIGGGGGGGSSSGRPGGSGGGGGGSASTVGGAGEVGPPRQGYNGGTGYNNVGGGGGGAGQLGGNDISTSEGGDGGNGLQSAITGVNTYYAGGGGGACMSGYSSVGGLGGGGNSSGTSGTNGLGGGGGARASASIGGKGGSGIVVIRYTCRIQNLAPTAVTNTQATLNAVLYAPTTNFTVYVHWGTTDGGQNLGSWDGYASVGSWTNVASTNISYLKTGLSDEGTYWYTFRASNDAGNVWSTTSWMYRTPGSMAGTVFFFE